MQAFLLTCIALECPGSPELPYDASDCNRHCRIFRAGVESMTENAHHIYQLRLRFAPGH